MEQGYVIGGGLTLKSVGDVLREQSGDLGKGEVAGWEVVASALQAPQKALRNTRGETDATGETGVQGLDVTTGAIVDLGAAGVVDPAKTIGWAIRIAVSYSRSVLSTIEWDQPGD